MVPVIRPMSHIQCHTHFTPTSSRRIAITRLIGTIGTSGTVSREMWDGFAK